MEEIGHQGRVAVALATSAVAVAVAVAARAAIHHHRLTVETYDLDVPEAVREMRRAWRVKVEADTTVESTIDLDLGGLHSLVRLLL